VLLWYSNIYDHREQRTESAMLAPCAHERLLVVSVFGSVVVCLLVVAKEQRLSNEIDCVRATAEASLRWIKVAKLARHSCDRGEAYIVIMQARPCIISLKSTV
jgi:hypothetical protein